MENPKIYENAENTTRMLNSVVYCVGLLLCIIAFIGGVIIFFDELELGLLVIASSIVAALSIVLIRALVDTIINISVKLCNEQDILIELQKIRNILNRIENNSKKEDAPIQAVSSSGDVVRKKYEVEPVVLNTANIPVTTQNSDLDNMILGEIASGNEIKARYLLMQKMGLSLNAAIEYINKIKAGI